MKTIFSFFLLLFFAQQAISQSAQPCNSTLVSVFGTPACNNNPWRLTYSDEFDGNLLDENKWALNSPEFLWVAQIRQLPNLRCFVTPQNISVSNGTLKLHAKAENIGTQCVNFDNNTYCHDFKWSGAELWSNPRFGYGKYECRLKIPVGDYWPAFWSYWGDPGVEIDFAEFTCNGYDCIQEGGNPRINLDYHLGPLSCGQTPSYPNPGDFHTIEFEWDPYIMIWKVDGVIKRTVTRFYSTLGQLVNCGAIPLFTQLIRDNVYPTYGSTLSMIFGNGPQDPNNINGYPSGRASTFEIDYFKYYQRKPCSNNISITSSSQIENYNTTGDYFFSSIIGNNISIGGNTVVDYTINNGRPNRGYINILASNDITFSGEVEIKEGHFLEAKITDVCNPEQDLLAQENDDVSFTYPLTESLIETEIGEENSIGPQNNDSTARYAKPEDQQNDISINIYPNPFNNVFNIRLGNDLLKLNTTIDLYDITGKVVLTFNQSNQELLELNTSSLPNGLYLLKISCYSVDGILTEFHKIIKQSL